MVLKPKRILESSIKRNRGFDVVLFLSTLCLRLIFRWRFYFSALLKNTTSQTHKLLYLILEVRNVHSSHEHFPNFDS